MVFRLLSYIKETRQELTKVNWPTRQQIVLSTILVIVLSLAVALFLGGLDYVYQQLLERFIF